MEQYIYRAVISRDKSLSHYGIKDMKWGVRRFQNEDGSLTPAGRERYGRIASHKPNLANMISGGTGAAVATGFNSGGILGGVVGGVGGAVGGYAAYKISKKRYDNAVKKLKDDDARKQKEYEQSEEHQQFLKKLQSEGARLNAGGADSYQSQKNKDMIRSFREAEWHKSEWAQSHGLNSPKAVSEYVKKALKNFNENDPDQIVYQHMAEVIQMRDKGYISKKTFAKLYDGQLAEDAFDFANYGDSDWLDRWHDMSSKEAHKGAGQQASGESDKAERLGGVPATRRWSGRIAAYQNASKPDPADWKDLGGGRYSPTANIPKQPSGKYIQVSDKKRGVNSMVRIDDRASAAVTLGYMGYSRSEIASKLGISEEQLKKELASYNPPSYNGGIGVGKIRRK